MDPESTFHTGKVISLSLALALLHDNSITTNLQFVGNVICSRSVADKPWYDQELYIAIYSFFRRLDLITSINNIVTLIEQCYSELKEIDGKQYSCTHTNIIFGKKYQRRVKQPASTTT
jgi:hypothetical protein